MENHKSYFYIIYEINLHNKEKERKNENQKNLIGKFIKCKVAKVSGEYDLIANEEK